MLKYEFYKIIKQKFIFIFLGLILAFTLLNTFEIYFTHHLSNIVYNETDENIVGEEGFIINRKQAEKYAGPLTDELAASVLNNRGDLLDTTTLYFSRFFKEVGSEDILMVSEVYPDIDFELNYGYADSWEYFFKNRDSVMRLFPVFIIIVFAPLFAYDAQYKMSGIIHTTIHGKEKAARAKIKASLIIINIVLLIITIIQVAGFYSRYGLLGYSTSIQVGYNGYFYFSTLPMNYLDLVGHNILLNFLGMNIILLITIFISMRSSNILQAFLISAVLCYGFTFELLCNISINTVFLRLLSLFPVNALGINNLAKLDAVSIFGYKVGWIYVVEIVNIFILFLGYFILIRNLSEAQKYNQD